VDVFLEVYGLRIRLRGNWDEVLEMVRLDYAWFETDGAGKPIDVEVLVERGAADFDQFAALPSAFVTPRYAVFADPERTVVDYQGVVRVLVDATETHVDVRGEVGGVAHEAVYYFLLGRIGRHLDANGLVRVHALGLAGDDGGVVVLLPSSGGKSSLAMQSVTRGEGMLCSEDSPLLDRRGRLHPFPLRIAVGATTASTLAGPPTRALPNPSAGHKLAIEVSSFADRIAPTPVALRHVVLGVRSLGREARLEEKTRVAAAVPLVIHAVVGSGLYQGFGYAHQRGVGEFVAKLGVAALRSRACAAALRGARVWQLTLSRDPDASWHALRPLLKSRS
jgi:hypothetical protein